MNKTTIDDLQVQDKHEEITEELILKNPCVFGLNHAKINQLQKINKESDILKIPRSFDYFNKRTEFPYDLIDNPMKLNPHGADEL